MMGIQQELVIRSENIQRIYSYYLVEKFLVNRRYQRKLVWTVEEKAAFIDSIRKGFPVPLFLVAEVTYNGDKRFEIIDGMQRLNAIVSFIEQEFDLEGFYFDLNTMAESKLLLDDGKLPQKTPKLDREVCTKIAGYTLPLSVSMLEEKEKIDEIFMRINASGRHLSKQELRQAGATGDLPQLVRKISYMLRGDISHSDMLFLNQMKQISITNKRLPYGINIKTIPWISLNIITPNNMRNSRDEELIAHLIAYMSLGEDSSPSANALDKYYGFDESEEELVTYDIENAIQKIGSETLEKQFLFVYEEMRKILESSRQNFYELMFRKKGIKIPQHYQIIFLALYNLLIKRGMRISDYRKLADCLGGAGDNIINIKGTQGLWNTENRKTNIKAIIGVIQDLFQKSSNCDDPALNSWITQFENLLMQSKTEQTQYDFKIGFYRLDNSGTFDEKLVHKVFKTLTAMANNRPENVSYVIVGVADKYEDSKKYETIYGSQSKEYNNFYITGIQGEAHKYERGIDLYFRKIKQYVDTEPITPDSAKHSISRNMRLVNYYDKSVLVLKIESGEEPYFYDGKIYERHGANIQEVDSKQYTDVYKRFLAKM